MTSQAEATRSDADYSGTKSGIALARLRLAEEQVARGMVGEGQTDISTAYCRA
ncbi:hypothetical protein V1292_000322 [Bradyrhizobium sp. AZCC 1719]